MEAVEILGVRIACLDQQGLLDQALLWSEMPGRHTVFYANAHCLNLASQDLTYLRLLNEANLVYADGISLVWSSRILRGCRLEKLTGADWIWGLCERASERGIRLYLLGGKPGVAERAASNLQKRYRALKIVGTADGFFHEKSTPQILAEIQASEAQIVLVGLGAPHQERWIAMHGVALGQGVWWGVGALLDFVAGDERRVPDWLYRLSLEWLWRLSQDPRGKWRRYLLGNPIFFMRVLRQYFVQSSKY